MNILISGASGLLGRKLKGHFEAEGHTVSALARGTGDGSSPCWDPAGGYIDLGHEKIDAVIHLAGENIANGRWTAARKKRIRDSRVVGTRLLAGALAELDPRPEVMITASAVGYYGNRGDEVLDESSPSGEGFLASVCREWEVATQAASAAGIRVVSTRCGMILSPTGGALGKMLTPFKMGLAGSFGNGRQYVSWISIDDVAKVMAFVLADKSISGPVNTVSPNPVTNAEFTKMLASALHRPALMPPLPRFAAKLLFGEMADELFLSSTRAVPKALLDRGFRFSDPDLMKLFTEWFA